MLGGIAFLVSVYAAIAEAIAEKDWPRETFKFVLWFGVPLAILAAVVWS